MPPLDGIEAILNDPLRFKLKLRMGEDTYALMRTRKRLQEMWDVYGMAAAGAGAAASPFVASTLFASTAGPLAIIGIGTAATPIGWVLGAGAAAGGLYFGVTRWVAAKSSVDVIPHAINTPLDVLAMSLFDLMGSLALRVARIDGHISESERAIIHRHFIDDWGFAEDYATLALGTLEANGSEATTKAVAASLAQFQHANPDCRADVMQGELMHFLQALVAADGIIDEREELALDAIKAEFIAERRLTLANLRRAGSTLVTEARSAVGNAAEQAGRLVDRFKTDPSGGS